MQPKLLAVVGVGDAFSVSLRFVPKEPNDRWYVVSVTRGVVTTETGFDDREMAAAVFRHLADKELMKV